jgi:hypothetical protein
LIANIDAKVLKYPLPRVVDGLDEDEREGSGATSRDNVLAELLGVAGLLVHLESKAIKV